MTFQVRLSESFASVGIDAKQQTLKGLELPISDEAIDGFFCLKEGKINYLQVFTHEHISSPLENQNLINFE